MLLVHQEDIRFNGKSSCDAETLLLAAGKSECGFMETVFQFVPDCCLAKALFNDFIKIGFLGDAFESRTVSNVVINALRERVRLLEYHAYMTAENDRIDFGVCIDAGEKDIPFYAAARNEVVHAVQRAQECGFAAAGWSDESGNLILFNAQVDVLQCLESAVVEIYMTAGKLILL